MGEMDNNGLFLQSFNIIEKRLKDDIDVYNNVPFYELVEKKGKLIN